MGTFYKPSSYRKFRKYLKKKGFNLREGGEHLVATHPVNEEIEISVPRHTRVSNGVTEGLCDKLVELGFDKEEIKRCIL